MPSASDILKSGFPGPRLAGIAFVLAPLLLAVGAGLLMDFEGGAFEENQSRIAAQPLRAELGLNLFIAGWAVAVLAVFALARLIAQPHPTLATAAGLVALAGLVVSLTFGGIATYEHGIAQYADRAVAASVNDLIGPPIVLLLLVPGIPLGWILLGVGAYRAGIMGPLRAAAVAGPALVPVGAIGGFPFVLPVAFVALAIALVPLGIELLRSPSGGVVVARSATSE